VIDLSQYVFEALRKDQEFILYRGRGKDFASQVLVLSPAVQRPRPKSLKWLEHAYSLREELDPIWAARPAAIARHSDRTVLVLEDRRIGSFSLGAHDISDRLLIPEKLYGRDREIKTLVDAFDQVVTPVNQV
jgi:hypothetical protein